MEAIKKKRADNHAHPHTQHGKEEEQGTDNQARPREHGAGREKGCTQTQTSAVLEKRMKRGRRETTAEHEIREKMEAKDKGHTKERTSTDAGLQAGTSPPQLLFCREKLALAPAAPATMAITHTKPGRKAKLKEQDNNTWPDAPCRRTWPSR